MTDTIAGEEVASRAGDSGLQAKDESGALRSSRYIASLRIRRRVAVLGEFNSGKTALVNAIIGAEVLKPSALEHTTHATVVRFAAQPSMWAELAGGRRIAVPWGADAAQVPADTRRLHIGVPLARLRSVTLVDTPGLGLDEHEDGRAAARACRSAHSVIWCTPAMQAWKASEEQAWLALPEHVRGRGVLAVTFADEIASQRDVARLMARLQADAGPHFRAVVMAGQCAEMVAA